VQQIIRILYEGRINANKLKTRNNLLNQINEEAEVNRMTKLRANKVIQMKNYSNRR
jgi:hypothetical protein